MNPDFRPFLRRELIRSHPFHDMNKSQQTIGVAAQPKLGDAQTPVRRQRFGHFTQETESGGKSLAMREYIKANYGGVSVHVEPAQDGPHSAATLRAEAGPGEVMSKPGGECVVVQPSSQNHAIHDPRADGADFVGSHVCRVCAHPSPATQKQEAA